MKRLCDYVTEKELYYVYHSIKERGDIVKALKITKDNFTEEVLESKSLVLLDFWASWCGPCRMVSPIIDEIADENSHIVVGKVNVDEEFELAAKFGITSIPSLIVMKDGKEYRRSLGAIPKEKILSMLV